MPTSQTKVGTRKLSEVARHLVVPSGIVATGWPAVRDKCLELGVRFDDWQHGLGRAALAKRADGKYAAGIGGVVISIPRQVGKTYTVGAILFALCLLSPGLTVIWTAHRMKTAGETFRSMQSMARRSRIRPFIEQVFTGSGDEEIRFRNGSRILFGARERGFGRGFAEVDVEVFDEAQILTEKALEDMVPATNQSRQPSGALLFFMGTPPRPMDPGEAFAAKRRKALAGESANTLFVEFSADRGASADDRKQWAKANPSYPKRTPEDAMLRMRENLGSDESFLREALGIWDDEGDFRIAWLGCADPLSMIEGRSWLAVSMTPDRLTVSLVAAGRREDGRVHVETVLHGNTTDRFGDKQLPFLPEVAAVAKRQNAQVALVPSHPAGAFAADLEKAGVTLRLLTPGDYTRGCGALYDDVTASRLRYIAPQPELDAAIGRATRKSSGEAWRWAGDDISALVAATQAAQAVRMAPIGGKGRAIALG